ncbi:MAG: hypothetical protein GY925_19430 [Actinomycetia bacterium]|nr:hypothetical protein [Actinomycetes bacterium]
MVAAVSSRTKRVAALEQWADQVEADELVELDTSVLRVVAGLVEERDRIDAELTDAVRSARAERRSWSQIGAMLGVSKQAAQRKYGSKLSARAGQREAEPSRFDGVG